MRRQSAEALWVMERGCSGDVDAGSQEPTLAAIGAGTIQQYLPRDGDTPAPALDIDLGDSAGLPLFADTFPEDYGGGLSSGGTGIPNEIPSYATDSSRALSLTYDHLPSGTTARNLTYHRLPSNSGAGAAAQNFGVHTEESDFVDGGNPCLESSNVMHHRRAGTVKKRKDTQVQGSKLRKNPEPAVVYDWKPTDHGWMDEQTCDDVERDMVLQQCQTKQGFLPYKRPLKFKSRKSDSGTDVAERFCPFHRESGCKFKVRRVRRANVVHQYVYSLETNSVEHVDHNLRLVHEGDHVKQRQHLPLAIKALIHSPSKLAMKPRALVRDVRDKGFNLSQGDVKRVKQEQVRQRKYSFDSVTHKSHSCACCLATHVIMIYMNCARADTSRTAKSRASFAGVSPA